MLERLVREQLELLHDVRQRHYYTFADQSQRLLREHAEIAEAVISRDVYAAQSLMQRHIAHTRQCLTGSAKADAKRLDERVQSS